MTRYLVEDDRIGLLPMTYEDCAQFVEWRNHDSVRSHYIYREPFTLQGEQEYFLENVASGKVHILMICDKEHGGRKIGATIVHRGTAEGSAEYGLFIGEETRRGLGLGRRATALTIQCAFAQWGYKKLMARIFSDNTASQKSTQAGGFRRTGILKDVECTDGEVKDMYTYEVLAEDMQPAAG